LTVNDKVKNFRHTVSLIEICSLVGSHIRAFDLHQHERPWTTLNGRNAPLAEIKSSYGAHYKNFNEDRLMLSAAKCRGAKVCPFPQTLLVVLRTVLRYRVHCDKDKKLSYRRETARQLHTSFSAHSLIVHFTEHHICFTTI